MGFLFAIDAEKKEVIVSESQRGSNKIDFIERISRDDNPVLFDAVQTLTSITKAPEFDGVLFKSMNKVCQLVYNKHVESIQ